MKTDRRAAVRAALVATLALPLPLAAQVDISQMPMSAKSQATPNLIFGVDDSGSMDWEVLSTAPGGQYYWNDSSGGFYTDKGVIRTSVTTSGGNEYAYLFPNGYANSGTTDRKKYNNEQQYGSVPPTPEFGYVRSAEYNPMYYNPSITYVPWQPARLGGSVRSFANANPTAARSHPWFPTSGAAATFDLTNTLDSTDSHWTFRIRKGMKLGGITGVRTRTTSGSTWTNRASDWESTGTLEAAIPYYPATYWAVDASCTGAAPTCSTAPDGKRLRRIEIKSNSPAIVNGKFPSGRTYAEEIQNFANWFQYYRKRKLLLSAAMSTALSPLKGIRGGTVYFNSQSAVTMYDFASDDDTANGKVVLGAIYANPASGGTPTGQTLKYIGDQFRRTGNSAPIQFSCQRNAAFVLTDGYANGTKPTTPAYDKSIWHGNKPYTTTYTDSIADVAASYYTNNLRPDLPTGLLSVDPTDTSPNADRNTDLHMQTFAITMGALGSIYGQNTAQARNPFVNPPTWPSPANDQPSSIDDLWHATINGRGEMYAAYNAEQVTNAMQEVVRKILVAAGSDAGIAVSTVNLRAGDNTAFVSSYNARNWTGDLAAFKIDLVTGDIDMSPGKAIWSTQQLLEGRAPNDRIIASYNGTSGVPFVAADLGGTLVDQLGLVGGDGAQVLAWLRGDRSLEGTTYRQRDKLLGDIVTAEPLYAEGVVYQAANDGMLHAFDANNGQELWAYVPYNVIPKLKQLADPLYQHEFFVDGTPVAAKIDSGSRTILVGGLRGGGSGFYALDITNPRPGSETALAGKVLWEFPNASTPAAVRNQIGMSFGKPVIVKTESAGWVVLLSSGYNPSAGGGRLFALDAVSGALLATISAPASNGLAQLSAWVDDPTAGDATTKKVYGGDLAGNLWRFDLNGAPASWSASKLIGLGTSKPITSAPELAMVNNEPIILFGTGRLLGDSDLVTANVQSVYGIADRGTTIANPSTQLFKQDLSVGAGGVRHVTNQNFDWSTYHGWYFDLPAGERVSTDPSVILGALVFTSNRPSAVACSTESFLYAVSVTTGGQMPPSSHFQNPWSGKRLGFAYSSRPVTVTLPSGKVVAITHKSDTSSDSTELPIGTSSALRKLGWREVFR